MNNFDIISLTKINTDIILFYKETSQIPVHAAFFNIDLSEIDLNFEMNKVEVLMDVLAYFENITLSKELNLVKSTFKIMNE